MRLCLNVIAVVEEVKRSESHMTQLQGEISDAHSLIESKRFVSRSLDAYSVAICTFCGYVCMRSAEQQKTKNTNTLSTRRLSVHVRREAGVLMLVCLSLI